MSKLTRIVMLLMCMVFASEAMAQKKAKSKASSIEAEDITFEILKLQATSVDYSNFGPELPKVKSGRKLRWGMIMIEYQWSIKDKAKKKYRDAASPKGNYYLDGLELDWRVVLAETVDGKAPKPGKRGGYNIDLATAVRMRKRVNYVNVVDKGKHIAVIFIEGGAIDRYLKKFYPNKVFTELAVKVDGTEILRMNALGETFVAGDAEEDEKKLSKFIPRKKRDDVSLHRGEKATELRGVLRSKENSPWRWSQLDAFEVIDSITTKE